MVSQKYIYPSLFPEEELNENISSERKEYDLTNLFERLAKSDFRSRFHLSMKDREYIMEKGLHTIRNHAEDFIAKRLAPAVIPNDGKQTPMRGHPVFWPNMPLAVVAGAVSSSGIIFQQAGH